MEREGGLRFAWVDALDTLPAPAWDALSPDAPPFVQHAFLSGLERHGCLGPQSGWTPCHATLWRGVALIAAAPGYRKSHSRGEFVFDQPWAEAYAAHGQRYYPKWLGAVPYSPVPGPRILAREAEAARTLLQMLPQACREAGFSSAHFHFIAPEPGTASGLEFGREWLIRHELQFHWQNPGWRDFEDFLAALSHKRRKNIRQERAHLARAGIRFIARHGDEIRPHELEAMHRFHLATFNAYGNSSALNLDFFRHLARQLPRHLVVFLALQQDQPIAGALCLRSGDTLYGRYWGSQHRLPGLHFETCYYQGIEYCLRQGLHRFEPGAQGEHKLARGFLPVLTHSRHRIFNPEFEQALRRWCAHECALMVRYRATLAAHSPFRHEPA